MSLTLGIARYNLSPSLMRLTVATLISTAAPSYRVLRQQQPHHSILEERRGKSDRNLKFFIRGSTRLHANEIGAFAGRRLEK